jgi:SAM-dependent methyltransferase
MILENSGDFIPQMVPYHNQPVPIDDMGGLKMDENVPDKRARTREIAEEFAARGDVTGWFEALYAESAGNNEYIPWADLEPNRFLRRWAESMSLSGEGRSAMVVGCGLGDDARYLHDLGFRVTAFDISPTAIEWARRLHVDTDIQFGVADLFEPDKAWLGAFDFVLEVYTIQPLPLAMRPQVIEAIAAFANENGRIVVVTHARDDDEEPDQVPWPVSRKDLSRFIDIGFTETAFKEMWDEEEEEQVCRFVAEYVRVSRT